MKPYRENETAWCQDVKLHGNLAQHMVTKRILVNVHGTGTRELSVSLTVRIVPVKSITVL